MKTPKTVLLITGFLSAACVLFGAGAKPKYFPPPGDASHSKESESTKTAQADSKKYFPAPDEKSASPSAAQKGPQKVATSSKGFAGLTIYSDDKSPDNHFAPSGWMGDFSGLKMDTAWSGSPRSGKSCIRFSYKPSGGGVKWVGVFWQDPPNNWGEKDGGYDLSGAEKLSFWARGENGGEIIKEIKVGGIKGNYSDSDEIVAGPITLESTWKQYSINLKGRDLSAISGGFCWSTDSTNNPDGFTFYVDDIKFE